MRKDLIYGQINDNPNLCQDCTREVATARNARRVRYPVWCEPCQKWVFEAKTDT